jgi:hypothetical protein
MQGIKVTSDGKIAQISCTCQEVTYFEQLYGHAERHFVVPASGCPMHAPELFLKNLALCANRDSWSADLEYRAFKRFIEKGFEI